MNYTRILKTFFFLLVSFSIFVIYYALVVENNFEVYTNEEGPDTSDYFLIEEPE